MFVSELLGNSGYGDWSRDQGNMGDGDINRAGAIMLGTAANCGKMEECMR